MSDIEMLKIGQKKLYKLYALTPSFLGRDTKADFVCIAWNFTEAQKDYEESIKELI